MRPLLHSFLELLNKIQSTKRRFAWGLYRLWLAFLTLLRRRSSHFRSSVFKPERPQNDSRLSFSPPASPAFDERSNAVIMPSYFPRSSSLPNLPATSAPLVSSSGSTSQVPIISNDHLLHPFDAMSTSKASSLQSSQNVTPKTSHPLLGRVVRPIYPSLLRYEKELKSPTEKAITSIPAVTIDFDSLRGECGVWHNYYHPEGPLLFIDEERNILTDAYLYDPTLREEVEEVISCIDVLAKTQHRQRPGASLVIGHNVDEASRSSWGYYYLDHSAHIIFWLEDVPSDWFPVVGAQRAATSTSIGLTLKEQFWIHCRYFGGSLGPVSSAVGDFEISELKGTISASIINILTSPKSSARAQFDLETLDHMLTVANNLYLSESGPYRNGHMLFCAATLNQVFCHSRLVNRYGERDARLEAYKGMPGKEIRRTALVTVLSPLLFWAPDAMLSDIERFWVEDVLYPTHWKEFVTGLQTQWSEFIAYAAILLAADMAFLAIPSVTPQDGNPSFSAIQVITYVSIMISIVGIIVALLLIRQNRPKTRADSSEAEAHLSYHSRSVFGFEPMTIVYSLPYALLMWAMITFLLAFLLLCFQNTSLGTRITIGVVSFGLLLLVLWCVTLGLDRWFERAVVSCTRWTEACRASLRAVMDQLRIRDRIGQSAESVHNEDVQHGTPRPTSSGWGRGRVSGGIEELNSGATA